MADRDHLKSICKGKKRKTSLRKSSRCGVFPSEVSPPYISRASNPNRPPPIPRRKSLQEQLQDSDPPRRSNCLHQDRREGDTRYSRDMKRMSNLFDDTRFLCENLYSIDYEEYDNVE